MTKPKLLTKSLKSKISLEKRLHFYSQLIRKSSSYLENLLGRETFQSLQNCELNQNEIELINQDLLSIILAERENQVLDLKLDSKQNTIKGHPGINKNSTAITPFNDLHKQLKNNTTILIRPELTICSELILEFLLSQKIDIGNIIELNLDTIELLQIYDHKLKKDKSEFNNLPTSIINYIHSPAKLIYLKESLSEENQEYIQANIIHSEYKLMSSIFGPRIWAILDPIKYIQNSYLGLIDNPAVRTNKDYLDVLEDVLSIS